MERWKKEAKHFRLAGGSCNKQENLLTGLVLDGHKTSRSLHLTVRMLKVYTEALHGFSHVYHPDGLNNTLLFQGSVLEAASGVERQTEHTFQRQGRE